jgi:hypothetical protein
MHDSLLLRRRQMHAIRHEANQRALHHGPYVGTPLQL